MSGYLGHRALPEFVQRPLWLNQIDQRSHDPISRTIADGTTQNYTTAYGYNTTDELTSANSTPFAGTAPANFSATYDGVGNRTDLGLGAVSLVNQYGSFTYNSRGDLTNDNVNAYGYDPKDRLNSVTPDNPTASSQKLNFQYDTEGRRTVKDVFAWFGNAWVFSYARRWAYSGSNAVAEFDGSNNLLKTFVWGQNNQLLAVTDYTSGSPKVYNTILDAQGNVVALTDVTGAVVASYIYDPYGKLVSAVGPAASVCPFLYGGGYRDSESGLILLGARYYSPALGRFLTRDPSGESGGENLYAYAANDPVNMSDSTGLAPDWNWWHALGSAYWNDSVVPTLKEAAGGLKAFDDLTGNDYIMKAQGRQPVTFSEVHAAVVQSTADAYTAKILAASKVDNFGAARDRVTSFTSVLADLSGASAISESEQGRDIFGDLNGVEKYSRGIGGIGQGAFFVALIAAPFIPSAVPAAAVVEEPGIVVSSMQISLVDEPLSLAPGGAVNVESYLGRQSPVDFGRVSVDDVQNFSALRNYDFPLPSSDIGSTGWVRTVTPWQRTVLERPGGIDWELVRPPGAVKEGYTNLEAAQIGYAPGRINPSNGNWDVAVLHHAVDDPRGTVFQTWLSDHSAFHQMIGREPNLWRETNLGWAAAWRDEVPAYWRWRTGTYDPPVQDRLWLPGDPR